MKTDYAAKAQHKSQYRPEQIRASIFKGVVLGPIDPHFAAAPVDSEAGTIGIRKAKMLLPGQDTNA
jgi:hypothetical protein